MAKRSDEEQYKVLAIRQHDASGLTRGEKGWLARVANSEWQVVASVVADEKEIARIGANAIATQLNKAGGW